MRLAHAPDTLLALRTPTPESPLRVLVSGCLAGLPCGVNATDYGLGELMRDLLAARALTPCTYCPEDVGIGTPRAMPDIHGGDGHDVLESRVELAILTDMSAACGTQVISDGCRLVEARRFRASVGVAAALLLRNGIPVVSQRDARSIGILREKVDPSFRRDPAALDYHQTPWYVAQFGTSDL